MSLFVPGIRVDVFLKMSAMEMIVQIAAAPLVSTLMTFSNWYPLGLSSILLVVAGFIAFLLPETRPQHPSAISSSSNPAHRQAFVSDHNGAARSEESYPQIAKSLLLRSFATSGRFLHNPAILLSLGVFVLAAWGAHAWALLLQFVSQKFGWEFRTVSPSSNPWTLHSTEPCRGN